MKYLIAILIVGWAMSVAKPSNAHPHAWIDLWIEVVFDSTGAITGLRETWLFDDFYSVYATGGMDLDKDGQPDKEPMAKLVREILKVCPNTIILPRHGLAAIRSNWQK